MGINMAASTAALVDSVLKDFNNGTSKPENFLSVQNSSIAKFNKIVKQLYDHGQTNCPVKGSSGGLPELYTEGFIEEQIWQQLELHNKSAYESLMNNVAKILFQKNHLTFNKKTFEESTEIDEEIEKDDESSADELSDIPDVSDDADSDSDIDETHLLKFDEYKVLDDDFEKPEKIEPKKHKPSEVDDDFFKLGEMEDFLQKEEGEQTKGGDDNDIDLFEGIPSDEEEQDDAIHAKYSDFFKGSMLEESRKKKRTRDDDDLDLNENDDNEDNEDEDGGMEEDEDIEDMEDMEGMEGMEEDTVKEPNGKRVKFNFGSDSGEDSSSDDESTKPEVKSSFEQRQGQEKEEEKGEEREEKGPKPWQLMGESNANVRPPNALLEEDLFFDHTSRAAPVITEETTKTLEDIIKQRIKDQAFDDVERKVKPVYDPSEYKKKLVLDQEKSKFSLAEIYEQEYLKKQEEAEQQTTTQASSLADPVQAKE